MREHFPGFYPPSVSELTALWDDGIVAVDANALLNAYRYTARTREEFLGLLASFGPRLWLPHQAAQEFHENRLQVISDLRGAPTALLDGMGKAQAAFREATGRFRHHPELDSRRLLAEYETAVKPIVDRLEEAKEDASRASRGSPLVDPILNRITNIFAGKVDDGFSDEELATIFEEGAERYASKVPPGFKDSDKSGERKYGDLVIWKEVLRKAETSGMPMMLVTDDRKDDWWWEHQGKTIGPRVELVAEFARHSGKRIHLYTPEMFLRVALKRKKPNVSKESITEAQAVADLERERARAAVSRQLETIERERSRITSALAGARVQPGSRSVEAVANIREMLLQIDNENYHGDAVRSRLEERLRRAQSEDERSAIIAELRREERLAVERSSRRLTLEEKLERAARESPRARDERHTEFMRMRLNVLESEAADLRMALKSLDARDES